MTITFDLDPSAALRLRRSLGLGAERQQKLFVLDTPDLRHRAAPLVAAEDPGEGDLRAVVAITLSLAERADGLIMERASLIAAGQTAERLSLTVRRDFAAALRLKIADAEPVPVIRPDDVAAGYRLLKADAWQPVKAGPVAASPDMPLNQYLAGLIDTVIRHLLAQLQPLARDGRVEAVHQARVALRRLRAGLAIVGRLVDRPRADALRRKAQGLAAQMGRTRDLDVFLAETLPQAQTANIGEDGWPILRDYAHLQRRAEWALLARTVGGPVMLDLLIALMDWRDALVEELDDPRRAGDILPDLLEKQWKRCQRRGDGFDSLPVEARHEVRIELKKLRYILDFSKSLLDPKLVAPWEKCLSDLQDGLGALNDGATARLLLKGALEDLETTGAYAAGLLVGWLEARAMAQQPGLNAYWQRLNALPRPWRQA